MKRLSKHFIAAFAAALAVLPAKNTEAADWSVTELQYQFGKIRNPFADTGSATNILTFEHYSGYNWGDIFFFVDLVDDDKNDAFNDKDAYSEGYAFFSSAKLLGTKYSGLIKDVGVFGSYNYGADSNFLAYYAGVYVDWNLPRFSFLRTYVSASMDDSDFNEQNGWHADVIWTLPIELGNQRFAWQGHNEYMSQERNDFGKTHDWMLHQSQLRWDVGYAVTGQKDRFFIGTEYQYWYNKLGTEETENVFQALGVVRF